MNFALFMTPAFLASTFEIMPTWLNLLTGGDILGGALNLSLWLTPFLITLVGLHIILFKPMMSYLDQRDHETVGARKEASALNEQVEERLATLNERLQSAKAEANQLRANARAKAALKGQELLDAAREDAEKRTTEAVKRIQVERETAAQALKQTAEGLSSDIAGQVLGRALQA